MRRAFVAALAALPLVATAHGTAPGGRDPRSPLLREALAAAPGVVLPVWVFFDSTRVAAEERTAQLEALGGRVRHVSRWLNAVSVAADSAIAASIADMPHVLHMQRVGRLRAAGIGPATPVGFASDAVFPAQELDSAHFGPNWRAINMLGVPNAHRFQYTGRGVRIGILDTGFETRHQSLAGRQVIAVHDFVNDDNVVYDQPGDGGGAGQSRHGTRVWSLLGGYQPGTLVGPAHGALFILAKVDQEPGDTQLDEDRWVAGVEWAEGFGARIIHSSVVFRADFTDQSSIPYNNLNGDIEVTTRTADAAARRGVLVVVAVGDGGPATGSLSAPADGDSLIAVGATDTQGQVAVFSARGPTADNRVKPELVAPGVGLLAASSTGLAAYDATLTGTSYSAPLIAGIAAVLLEAWPDLSPMAVRNALVLSASRSRAPDNAAGFGIPNVASAILFPGGLVPQSILGVELNGVSTTIAPGFRWNAPLVQASMQPVDYRVEIATDSLFTNIVFTDSVRDAFTYIAQRAIRPAPELWWRVRARARLGVERLSAHMGPFVMPGWVRLLSPDPNQVTHVDNERPELSWVPLTAPPPAGPLTYDVDVLSLQTGAPIQTIRNVTTSSVRVPQPLVPNTSYRWRVIARTQLGRADTVESSSAFVVESASAPPVTLLQQNFPNPFPRPDLGVLATRIWFDLEASTTVELEVLDLRGRLIRRLIPAAPGCGPQTLPAGYYGRTDTEAVDPACVQTSWDGTDHQGREVARGVYVLRLRAGGREHFRRMIFLPGS